MIPGIWKISFEQDRWEWDGCALDEVAESRGTPAYVFSASLLDAVLESWNTAVGGRFPCCETFFSCKTAPVSGLLRRIRESGIGVEVVAAHELDIALRCGFAGSRIIFGGTGRSGAELKFAADAGLRLVIVDCLEELSALAAISDGASRPVPIALRLMLNVLTRGSARFNRTSAAASHFGFDPNTAEFTEALRICREHHGLSLVGLHSHIGSGLRDFQALTRNFEKLSACFHQLRAMDFDLRIINIGGGVAVPTVREFSALEMLRYAAFGVLPKPPAIDRENYFDEYLDLISRAYEQLFGGAEIKPILFLEPGRALVSSAGAVLCRVHHVRTRKRASFAVTDAGALSMGMSVLAEYHEIVPLTEPERGGKCVSTITGKIPMMLDLLYMNKSLPALKAGDLLLVMDAGAYMIPTATNFATLKAPVILLDRGRITTIQRRETVEDFLARSLEEEGDAL
jgi:diaminopimelate decarboxylase